MDTCVVGVTGGIAAYKAAELVRLLVNGGIDTRVVMTRNAARFVTPLTFGALSGNPVVTDMWAEDDSSIEHISLSQKARVIAVAPATANFIAKAAAGIADDFLSTMLLAATAKLLVCPSMNPVMFRHEAVQANLCTLRSRGVTVLEPGVGGTACGTEGAGRLPEPPEIFNAILDLLATRDLEGLRVLVTAGPTVEFIDPVRFISNRSSGKMGFAIAGAARRRGAEVVLVSGPTSLPAPGGVEFVPVKTAGEMRAAVIGRSPGADVVIKAAAVCDFRPKAAADSKIRKAGFSRSLELEPNPDILAELGGAGDSRPKLLVGFAAETGKLVEHARLKLAGKNLDMIVANDVTAEDAGFDSDTNKVKILYRDQSAEDIPLMSKSALADLLLDRIAAAHKRIAKSPR